MYRDSDRRRDYRDRRDHRERQEYIFGIRAVIEAMEAGRTVDRIFVRKDLGGDLARELFAKTREFGVPVQKVPVEKLNRITAKNHQGVVATLSPVEYRRLENIVPALFEEGLTPILLLLDGVTDTRNFGAIARSAECAGVDAIVIPDHGSASITPEAVKSSAGALFHIPVCRVRSLDDAARYLRQSGYSVVGASEKSAVPYTEVDFTVPVALVMGAEDIGISPEVLAQCDTSAAIPMLGNIGSLNVSVAAGVLLYEAVRQRTAAGFAVQ